MELRTALDRIRRIKDDVELARMRVASDATRAGFAAAVTVVAPGISERTLQIEIEAEFFEGARMRSATTPSWRPARTPPCFITYPRRAYWPWVSSC